MDEAILAIVGSFIGAVISSYLIYRLFVKKKTEEIWNAERWMEEAKK